MAAVTPAQTVGELLRHWRKRRGLSQLDVAASTGVSTRHLSFVETGRSRPSRELLTYLAGVLDVPLRERNLLLRAAGYAPVYRETPLDDPTMERIRDALHKVLDGHLPFPALVQDRWRTLIRANGPTMAVLRDCLPESFLVPPVNLLRMALHPDGLARHIRNFDEYAGHLVGRVEREVAGSGDPRLREMLDEVAGFPHVPSAPTEELASRIAVPLRLSSLGAELSMFSTIATFGTALDVTVDELTVEMFFPADAATDAFFRTHFDPSGDRYLGGNGSRDA
jgi:transcriptional regulator with XRE-family HTH domain